jgi:hypothetical protein
LPARAVDGVDDQGRTHDDALGTTAGFRFAIRFSGGKNNGPHFPLIRAEHEVFLF